MEKKVSVSDEALGGVLGGVIYGREAVFDTPEAVEYLFAVGDFARVAARMCRTKIQSREARFDAEAGKYGAYYTGVENSGAVGEYWESELTKG